jgi:hypothetical protein
VNLGGHLSLDHADLDEVDSAIDKKLIMDATLATMPYGVHLTDLFVGDVCEILEIDRPEQDRGYSDALLATYGEKINIAGFTVLWTYCGYAIYAGLTEAEICHLNTI